MARPCSTICLPVGQDDYSWLIDHPGRFRSWLDRVFQDHPELFPKDFAKLPTVAFVVPNMENDMHNGDPKDSVPAGDRWLRANLDSY